MIYGNRYLKTKQLWYHL